MKKLLILSAGVLILSITSCTYEDPIPRASFSAEYNLVEPNEIFYFTNTSYDANYFEWDFGDGYISNLVNPSHSYSQEGTYTVTLRAYNGSKVDVASVNIDVQQTTLEVIVQEHYTKDLIVNINVQLFNSLADWEDRNYRIISGRTDSYGSVIFKGVNTQSYFIDAYSSNFNNESLGRKDVNFIRTLPLEHAKHNTFIALVDELVQVNQLKTSDTNTEAPKRKKYVIKEIKRSVKDEKINLQSVK